MELGSSRFPIFLLANHNLISQARFFQSNLVFELFAFQFPCTIGNHLIWQTCSMQWVFAVLLYIYLNILDHFTFSLNNHWFYLRVIEQSNLYFHSKYQKESYNFTIKGILCTAFTARSSNLEEVFGICPDLNLVAFKSNLSLIVQVRLPMLLSLLDQIRVTVPAIVDC